MEVAEIIEAVDITEYIEQYTDLEMRPDGELWGCSPLKKEETPSFSVNPELQCFYDFSSGKGGNIISFIMLIDNLTINEAIEKLKSYAGISDDGSYKQVPSAVKVAKRYRKRLQKEKNISQMNKFPDTYMDIYEENLQKIEQWCQEGMSIEVLQKFQVKYDPRDNRLVYPITDTNGEIVNICGRTLDPNFKSKGLRKYTYYHKWGGEMNVLFAFAEHRKNIVEQKEIILFEGAKSVFLAETWGYKNACALLTSHLSDRQFELLIALSVPVVFALDEEIDVSKDKNIQRLKRYVPVSYVTNIENRLSPKDAPVDKGEETWKFLYERRRKL